ncbi:outer membrane beta-barrel family protein [Pedobacter sp.]|uniref:outer membrane beta-barrel family protein n=1 Tax=Pedobacter sp. TaxID=1411316 RepID=UPI0031DFD351
MNQIKQLYLLFLLLLAMPGFAQQTEVIITGRVIDEKTLKPLENAGIKLLSATDQKLLKGTLTNNKGEFALSTPPGRFDIKIEFIAYQTQHLVNKEIKQGVKLEDIILKEDVQLLKSVNVTAEKTTVELNLDKKVFNVGKDLISKGGSANDILNNVPSVNVDANGAISLRGNGSVQVLINGKPSMLTNNNGLEQIPASNIEKVEVITNPSSRYEAQGGGGIINIILKKNMLSGFNGSVQIGVGDPANYNSNLNLSYKTEKINLFSNIGYRYRNLYGSEQRYQSVFNNGIQTILRQNNEQGRNDDLYIVYLGMDYYLNAKNTLTGSFYHDVLVNKDTTNYHYNYYDKNNVMDSTINRSEHYREPQKFNQLELNYAKTFDKKDQKWNTSLQYVFWNDDENQDISQQKTFPTLNSASRLTSRDIESSDALFIQSDFTGAFSGDSKFEAGIRANIRSIRSDYWAKADGILLPAYDNKLKYNENIYGAYFQYENKFNKFNYLLGLRAELSDISISDRKGDFAASKNYIDLFPTANITYKLHKNTDLRLSYSRRINRPQFSQLNPFSGLSDIRNLTVGNPDLNPMYTNSFELGILQRWGKLTFNPSLYYKHATNYFEFILKQAANGFVNTPVNLDYEDRYGLEVSTTYNPLSWWRLSWDFNYYAFKQQGIFENKTYGSEDHTWFTRINSRMKFPKSFSIEYSFNYRAKNTDIQSVNKAQYRANIALSKDLFKDKVSVTLAVNNIFDSFIDKQVITTDTYYLESNFKGIGRLTTATLVYRFNRKKDEKDRLPNQE